MSTKNNINSCSGIIKLYIDLSKTKLKLQMHKSIMDSALLHAIELFRAEETLSTMLIYNTVF